MYMYIHSMYTLQNEHNVSTCTFCMKLHVKMCASEEILLKCTCTVYNCLFIYTVCIHYTMNIIFLNVHFVH